MIGQKGDGVDNVFINRISWFALCAFFVIIFGGAFSITDATSSVH